MKMKLAFDNEKYVKIQAEQILKRIKQFGNKLYLEFGGKLFDDYHASRVLPGFLPDTKIKMLKELKEQIEFVIVSNANDIQSNKYEMILPLLMKMKFFVLLNYLQKWDLSKEVLLSRNTIIKAMPILSLSN